MADNAQKKQPTILIKKADGTSKRVSLAEFQKMKEMRNTKQHENTKTIQTDDTMNIMPQPHDDGEKSVETKALEPVEDMREMHDEIIHASEVFDTSVHADTEKEKNMPVREPEMPIMPIAPAEPLIVEQLPQVEAPHELATTTPVKHYFEDIAAAEVHADNFDHRSLLEEDLDEVREFEKQGARHVTHADIARHDTQVKQHVKNSNDNAPRLASLIASWKKGIRSDDQFVAQATKSREQGGVGLEQAQAKTLLSQLKKNTQHGDGVAAVVPGKKVSNTPMMNSVTDIRIPTAHETVPDAQTLSTTEKKQTVPDIDTSRDVPYQFPSQKIDYAKPKKTIGDVTSALNRKTMGPEEEIARFSIADFRRLARDPDKAGEMLAAKFSNWQEEDYLLYLAAKSRWHESPLFQMYLSVGMTALREGKLLKDVLAAGQSELNEAEYLALVEVNKNLT